MYLVKMGEREREGGRENRRAKKKRGEGMKSESKDCTSIISHLLLQFHKSRLFILSFVQMVSKVTKMEIDASVHRQPQRLQKLFSGVVERILQVRREREGRREKGREGESEREGKRGRGREEGRERMREDREERREGEQKRRRGNKVSVCSICMCIYRFTLHVCTLFSLRGCPD